jgi:hypothetical protein
MSSHILQYINNYSTPGSENANLHILSFSGVKESIGSNYLGSYLLDGK